jgi:hypothetical protein
MTKRRKVIQIITVSTLEGVTLACLCNDGTMWMYDGKDEGTVSDGEWSRLKDIPQDH